MPVDEERPCQYLARSASPLRQFRLPTPIAVIYRSDADHPYYVVTVPPSYQPGDELPAPQASDRSYEKIADALAELQTRTRELERVRWRSRHGAAHGVGIEQPPRPN